ncbi:hypothetical protein B0H34DRAFT_798714 [Crassisporium funariophilum]|nr:hypothetical protein B0H34DRAFT_798714 [Crassisporium funariophilum]
MRHKALVYGIYAVEALQTILLSASGFQTYARGFGDPASLEKAGLLWLSVPILRGVVAFVAQTFYVTRIVVLTGRKFLAGPIMLLAFIQLGAALVLGIELKRIGTFKEFLTHDIVIVSGGALHVTLSLQALLRRRKAAGVQQTHAVLTRIIMLTIETGLVTAAVAITTMILVFLPGQPTYYQASIGVLGKFYSNSMLVMLNGRMSISSIVTSSGVYELNPTSGKRLIPREEITFTSSTQARMTVDGKAPELHLPHDVIDVRPW